jgi:ubiquitin carboxyl-terminal hydrolase L5
MRGPFFFLSSHLLLNGLTREKFENSLRRHNHVGLMHALLDALAKAGKLEEAKQGARRVMQERLEATKGKDMSDD